jgi:hypothetical protein
MATDMAGGGTSAGSWLWRDVCVGEIKKMAIQGSLMLMLGAVWCSVRVDRIAVDWAGFRAGCDVVLACAQLWCTAVV